MPLKHKETNTIKFLPFADRLANVDIDVIHRVGHRYEESEEDLELFFRETLVKWTTLNCTQHWGDFRKSVADIRTLPQLILLKEQVVNELITHINMQDPLTLQPILEMVVAAAKDLRQEFYPHFPVILQSVISILASKNAEVLEWAFHCLAHLFKLLWRCMVQKIGPVLNSLIPLLSSKRPKYINHFAADSFAFLARKVKNPQTFLSLILKEIEQEPESLAGCGRLLFSWLRGVKKQFHSCARTLFPMFLRSLGDDSISTDLLCDLLAHTLEYVAIEIRIGGTTEFWSAAIAVMGHFINEYKASTSDEDRAAVESKISRLLSLEKQLAGYDNGAQLPDARSLATQLTDLLNLAPSPSENLLSLITDTSTGVLLSTSSTLPQQIATNLTHTLLKLPYTSLILKVTEQLLDWGSFDSLVLPTLLELCGRAICEGGTTTLEVSLLAQLVIHKAPPLQDGADVDHIHGYTLDFSPTLQKMKVVADVSSFFTSQISSYANTDDKLLPSVELVSKLLLILPHVRPIKEEDAKSAVTALGNTLLSALEKLGSIETETRECDIANLLFALMAAFECLIRFHCNLGEVYPVDRVLRTLLPLAERGERYVVSLRLLDIFFSGETLKNYTVNEADKLVDQLHEALVGNFSKPHHQVRYLTCRIFSLVPASPELQSLYAICLKGETAGASISEYRDKLQFMQRLECDAIRNSLLNHQVHITAPLHLLLGSLYINFQLIWQPVQLVIASYAQTLPVHVFWPVFYSRFCLSPKDQHVASNTPVKFSSDFLTQRYNNLNEFDDRPDFCNFRLLLWQAGIHFSEVCEKRNRDVVTSLLSFVNGEYLKTSTDMAMSWNIKQNECEVNEAEDESSDTEYDDDDEEKEDGDAPPTKRKRKNSEGEDEQADNEQTPTRTMKHKRAQRTKEEPSQIRLMTKTLQTALTLMSKMRNPKVLYCEPEVKKLYYEFLSHKNDDVQKAALDCILTYRIKSLTPYSERLYALIDSKKFKNEMISFRIDKESNMIQVEHRTELIPVIMRIVHSKMSARAGLRTGGKGGSALRRSMVMRFLAGCQEEEMLVFFKMAFRFFSKQMEDDPVSMVNKIISSLDLENVVPPRRLQSAVNLLSVVLERFGGLMGPQLLTLVVKLLLCVGATTTGMLNQRESIHAGYLNSLRQLRISCLNILTTFFDRLTTYEWSASEIDAILDVFVWPLLPRLSTEGIYSPTALFKLFVSWSQHPRYIPLLGAHSPKDPRVTPLPVLMTLMLGAKTNATVSSAVLELVNNLLTLADHKTKSPAEINVEIHDEYEAPPIPISHAISIDYAQIEQLQLTEEMNMGSKLLLPHVEAILERLHARLATAKPGRGMGLTTKELSVLSAVSELVRTPASSASLVRLLLPMVTRRAMIPVEDDESVLKMLTSLKNLIHNVDNSAALVRQLAPLFSVVRGSDARRLLVGLTSAVASTSASKEAEVFARLAADFNANDARWVNQPDFDRQLNAYKEAGKMIEEQTMTADVGALVMHQCFYVSKTEKDLSLKDSAGHCMRVVGSGLAQQLKKPEEIKFFIDDTILELIRVGIRDKEKSEFRERSVLLLGEMARNCGDLHPVLRDCSYFANKADIEVDFFENLQHLQLFRRNRALLKFSEIARKLEITPSPRTLTQFMVPLVSQFLCNDVYVKKNTIVDAAIDAVGVICRLLPWRTYEAILKFHLMRLRGNTLYQKQLIRVVVSILDAFHFDLSRAKGEKPPPVVEKAVEDVPKVADEKEEKDTAEESNFEEDLKDDLEATNDEENEENEEMDTGTRKTDLAIERTIILSPSAARKVMQSIAVGFLPQLHRVLTARTIMDGVHRMNKKLVGQMHDDKDAEDEEVRRIPVALAAVKLLQRLPENMLATYLPGICAKLCNYLKSRLETVRRVTRETMHKIMESLGPSYLPTLLQEMTTVLNRGFFIHVLVYTMHSVIVNIQDKFKPGDMDKCVQDILAVCKVDLFGAPAEDKEQGKVAKRVQEARSTKSLDTLHLLAKYVSESCLIDLIVPFKAVIQSAHSHKIVNRVSECLRQIVLGLSENSFILGNALLLFGLGVASESVPNLMIKKKQEKTEVQKEREARRRPDSFLLPEQPKRHVGIKSTDAARTAARMNAHVLVEFGLRLILILLKHEQIRAADKADAALLDSLIPILKDCISSKHVQLSTFSLQCLAWVMKMDLPSLESHIEGIASSIFALLHKYGAAGLSKGDNFEMVVAAFKTVAVLVRSVKFYTLTDDQLKALLLYAEQDLNDVQRHATAFGLLRAILARKLITPEIHDVMERVATVSITSEVTHVRVQARSVFHHFLLDYPLGKKLKKHLLFYISQLSYNQQSGRESALEMMNTVIATFPINILKQHASMMYVALGARLVNDDSPECRRMAAKCVTVLLRRVDKADRSVLFSVTMVWFRDEQVAHRRLAAQLCGLFVESEKEEFLGRLPAVLPEVVAQFSSDLKDVKNRKEDDDEEKERKKKEFEKMKDHHIYQVLQLVLKICTHCPGWMHRGDLSTFASNLTEHSQNLLGHPHEWVRLAASEFLTSILSGIDVCALGEAANKKEDSEDGDEKLSYFQSNTRQRLKCLTLDLAAQLVPGTEVREELLMQVVKNLVILADVLKDVKPLNEAERGDGICLMWLVRRMRKAVNMEIVKAPTSTVVRTMVMNWAAAVAVKLSKEHIQSVLYHLMAPVTRELNLEDTPPEGSPQEALRNLARDVGKIIKKAAGAQIYNTTLSQLRNKMNSVQVERKLKRKHEAITDPELAAKRKIRRQQKKKETKKRQMLKLRGKKKFRSKEVDLEN